MSDTDLAMNVSRCYQPLPARLAGVTIERCVGHVPSPIAAQLREIYSEGAQLFVRAALRAGEAVTLKLQLRKSTLTLCLPAEVRWVRATESDAWRAVCTFREPISENDLEELVALGVFERRKQLSRTLPLQATARWELDPVNIPVTIQSFSPDGFCLASPEPAKHERVLVRLSGIGQEHISFRAKMQWMNPCEGGYLVGCSFENTLGYELVWDCVHPSEPTQHQKPPHAASLSMFSQVAIVVLLCWLVAMN